MKYILTEYSEGHVNNTYHDHKGEAVADMMQRADRPKTNHQVRYRVWSSRGYQTRVHAEATREAGDPMCVLCDAPAPSHLHAYCHECSAAHSTRGPGRCSGLEHTTRTRRHTP